MTPKVASVLEQEGNQSASQDQSHHTDAWNLWSSQVQRVAPEDAAEFRSALAKCFSTIEQPKKNRDNTYHKSRYADLEEVLRVVKSACQATGFFVVQTPYTTDKSVGVNTRIIHIKTGSEISFNSAVTPERMSAQGFGSAVAYVRRYALLSVFGLVGVDDDDGNAATFGSASPPKKAAAQQTSLSPEQIQSALKKISSAQTLKELESAWATLSEDERVVTKQAKNAAKARLSKEQKSGTKNEQSA